MTTAAATTSASPSASNDSSPMIQDDIGALEPNNEQLGANNQMQNNLELSSSAKPPQKDEGGLPREGELQHHNQQQQQQQGSPADVAGQSAAVPPTDTNATTTDTTTATTSDTTTTTTTSSSTSSSIATTNDATTASTKQQQSPSSKQPHMANASSHNNTEQKRPMNAFLLFCKRQRSLVREKYPNLENRGITKILGDWWSKLDKEQKSKYTDLARQHKEAFMKANPDFKWCKTPNVSNINNNNSNNITTNDCYTNNLNNHLHQNISKQHQLNSNRQQQQQQHQQQHQQQNHNHFISATNAELLSLQSVHNHYDVLEQSSNGTNASLMNNRHQLEAPKPPKKRFLERNDSSYTARNSYNANQHDINLNGTDIVPYISLDQDTLDRVIDKAFSEDLNSSPSGINTCKCSTRTTPNLTTSTLGANTTLSLTSSSTLTSTSASTNAYPMSVDEPVDFSMNRTIISSRQQIINNLVEKMLSEPNDKTSNFSKSNGTYSMRSKAGHPLKKEDTDNL